MQQIIEVILDLRMVVPTNGALEILPVATNMAQVAINRSLTEALDLHVFLKLVKFVAHRFFSLTKVC